MNHMSRVEKLFRVHYAGLCDYAFSSLRSRDAAEDIVQDVFVALSERPEGPPRDNAKAYLYRAVRNQALNYRKQHRILRRDQIDLGRVGPDVQQGTDFTVRRHQLAEAIKRGIEAMSPRQRQVFTLSRHHDLSYAEIAAVLGVGVRTVETHMTRALHMLREKLKPYRE